MKQLIIYTLLFILTVSCGQVEDHYRITGMEVKIAKYKKGDNPFCVDFSDSLTFGENDTIMIKINFVRQYFSTEHSPSLGIMYSPKGWEGCEKNIESLKISLYDSLIIVFGDSTINGFLPICNNPYSCQDNVETDCNCQSAISYINVEEFIKDFNRSKVNMGNQKYLGEKMENVPLIFFTTIFENVNDIQFQVGLEFNDSSSIKSNSNILEKEFKF